jgi:sugar O-acyltransferase (sialic acid O-acetyltransferase NeuD family)
MKNVVIYGAGSVGKMSQQIIEDINAKSTEYKILGYLDDDDKKWLSSFNEYKILGGVDWLSLNPHIYVALGFSKPNQKRTLISKLNAIGHKNYVTLIHPLAWISRRVQVGQGSIVYPGVHIDVDVNIGEFCLFNKLATIGHDTIIKDFVTLSPSVNIGGFNHIGSGVEFGINSASIQYINFGDWSIIGGGSMVIKDLPDNVVVAGVPAKIIRSLAKNE